MAELGERAFYRLCELVDYDDPDPMWSRICEWSERLRTQPRLPARVVELGGGSSFKLIFALHNLGYSGALEVVDLDRAGLDDQVRVHRWLDPGFTLEVSAEDVTSRRFDGDSCLVVGNHFVDDFIAQQVSAGSIDYAEAYADPELHRRYWSELASLGHGEVARRLASLFLANCEAPLLLNNYTSRFEGAHALADKVGFVNEVMRELAELLTRAGHRTELSAKDGELWLAKQRGVRR